MTFISSFLGAYFGVIMGYFTIEAIKEYKASKQEVYTREAPKNISSISDPMSSYEKYKDENSNLYRSFKNNSKVVNRIEIGRDEDSK